MTSLHSTTKVPDSEDGYCMDCGETFRYVGPDHVCYKTLRKLEADSERLDWLEETRPRVGLGEDGLASARKEIKSSIPFIIVIFAQMY